MIDQKVKTIWVYGPDGIGKSTYITKKLFSIGYQFFEILSVYHDDFRELATIDNKKKVLIVKNIRHGWPDEEIVSAWIRDKELYNVRKSFYNHKFEVVVFHSLYSPQEIYLKSSSLRTKIYKGEVLRLEKNKALGKELDRMLAEGEISTSESFDKTQPIVYKESK